MRIDTSLRYQFGVAVVTYLAVIVTGGFTYSKKGTKNVLWFLCSNSPTIAEWKNIRFLPSST